MTDEVTFCLDTSALVNPWNRYYAPDLAPGYWLAVPELVRQRRVLLSEEVREELERIDDELHGWASKNVSSWYPLDDDIQEVVTDIMARWGRLVDIRKDRSRADPWVIATAKVCGATVVTDEKVGTAKDPRIPYVCQELGIRCIDPYAFVREAPIRLV